MKYVKNKWTIIGAIVTGIVLLAAFSFGRGSTPQYFKAKVARGTFGTWCRQLAQSMR
jgi:hypothetical protein